MTARVAVLHQGFVPLYRQAFFELLARRSEIEYVVFHGDPPGRSGHHAAESRFDFPNVPVDNRELSIVGRTVVYQPVLRRVLGDAYAGVVLGAELKFAANVALWPLLKARRRPVILWGQGFEKAEDRGPLGDAFGAVGALAKGFAARHSDGYLVYTEGGARRLEQAGVEPARIAVVRNTINVEGEMELHERLLGADERSLRAERGLHPDSLVLLYTGRLYSEKRVPELIAAVHALRQRGLGAEELELMLLGDGPELERVRDKAAEVAGVHVRGAVYDRAEVASCMRVAAALAIPGKVGLAANHAFAHGLPVLTRESRLHAPEIEYVHHGENGLIVPGDERAFVEALAVFAADPGLRERLAAGALESRAGLTLEQMVRGFDGGVRRALARRGGGAGIQPPRVDDPGP